MRKEDNIEYSIFDPTGNITALVKTKIEVDLQPGVGSGIMKQHREVEQVGFVDFSGNNKTLPYYDAELRMAGGEFCGNASMSAALMYAINSKGHKNGSSVIRLKVSGSDKIITVDLTKEKDHYTGRVSMPPVISIKETETEFDDMTEAVPVVEMPGISHIIIDESSKFFYLKNYKDAASEAIRKWCKALKARGLGIMFFEEKEKESYLTPLVYVPGIDSLYWENSCASGSSACAAYLAYKADEEKDIAFKEPGGVIRVTSDVYGKSISLYGNVKLVSNNNLAL